MVRIKRHKTSLLSPDPVYRSVLITRIINKTMRDGKKAVARKLVYKALDIIKQKTNKDPVKVVQDAVNKLKPVMEVRSRRVGGTTYQVPMPVRPRRQESLAVRWLIQGAHKLPSKQYHTFAEKLAAEVLNVFEGAGWAFNKKQEVERMAESNKAFAHFRW
ncbi:MAG: 30S ribosomal protein S7 [bacterium]|nr:30S ribosomal protein S7 [bacterium]